MIRDIGFYMIASFIVWLMFFKGTFELKHSIALIAVYLTYFLAVVGSGICFAIFYKSKNAKQEQHSDNCMVSMAKQEDKIDNEINTTNRSNDKL